MLSLRYLWPPAGPIRTLCVSHFAKTTANGILMSVVVLYFTRAVHVAPGQVGLALSAGSAVGLLAAIPAGRLADKWGPRDLTVALLCLLGVFVCGYALARDFTGLLIVSALVLTMETAQDASVGALIAGLLPPGRRVEASSYMRAASNGSVILGAAAGAVGLYLNTHAVYVGLLVGAGALFATSGLAYLRVPRITRAVPAGEEPVRLVPRDAPYAVTLLLNTVLVMNSGVILVALPIWISGSTSAPAWLFPLLMIVNAVSVVLLQVRLSRGSEDVPGGSRALRRAGLLLAGCCLIFSITGWLPVWLAVSVLVVGALVHVMGEMLYSTGSWALAFGLAPESAQGQYQGMLAMSSQLGQMIAPVLMAGLLTHLGVGGWYLLAALFAVTGAAAPGVGRWAQHTRRPYLAAAEPNPVRL